MKGYKFILVLEEQFGMEHDYAIEINFVVCKSFKEAKTKTTSLEKGDNTPFNILGLFKWTEYGITFLRYSYPNKTFEEIKLNHVSSLGV